MNYSVGVLLAKQGDYMELKDDIKLTNNVTNITIDVYTYQNLISMVRGNEYNI